MKRISLIFLFIVSSVFVVAQENADVVGEWYSAKEDFVVTLFEVNQTISGRITWMKFPNDENRNSKTDLLNPDESLRARVGMIIMYGFTYIAGNIWDNGSIYIPKKGKTYSGMMKLKNENTLNLRGYIGFSFFERYSSTWIRVLDRDKFRFETTGNKNILIQLREDLEKMIKILEDISLKPADEVIQKIENESLLIQLRVDLGRIIQKIEEIKKVK